MNDQSLGRLRSPYLAGVSIVTAITAIGYTRLLGQQGDWPALDARQAFVLALLVAFAILSAIGAFGRPIAVRAATAAACAGGLLPLGFLGLFSIGFLLIVAGGIALIAWLRSTGPAPDRGTLVASAVSAVAAMTVLAVGFAVTG
jgi:hypothetical protein